MDSLDREKKAAIEYLLVFRNFIQLSCNVLHSILVFFFGLRLTITPDLDLIGTQAQVFNLTAAPSAANLFCHVLEVIFPIRRNTNTDIPHLGPAYVKVFLINFLIDTTLRTKLPLKGSSPPAICGVFQ